MKRPLIALSARNQTANPDNPIRSDNSSYFEYVSAGGGLPCIVFVKDEDEAEQIAHTFDGLLLTGGEDCDPALYGEENTKALVFFVFFHQIHHIFLRWLLILQLRYPFAGEQVVDGNLQNSAQRQHQGHLRQPLAALPFGNGFIADGKCVGKLPLGQVFFFSGIGYEFSDFNLIHRFSLLSAAIVSGEG